MIDLSNQTPIGKGTNRLCFIHPKDKDKCIKITHSNDFTESIKEVKYYKFLEKRNISWKYISKYYGKIETSSGIGYQFDLIKDYDGNISKTLTYYLRNKDLTSKINNPVLLLNKFKTYCLKNKVLIKDINTNNLVYKRINKKEGYLVLIDGLSTSNYLNYYSNYFFTKNTMKKWLIFEKNLKNKFPDNKFFHKLLNSFEI